MFHVQNPFVYPCSWGLGAGTDAHDVPGGDGEGDACPEGHFGVGDVRADAAFGVVQLADVEEAAGLAGGDDLGGVGGADLVLLHEAVEAAVGGLVGDAHGEDGGKLGLRLGGIGLEGGAVVSFLADVVAALHDLRLDQGVVEVEAGGVFAVGDAFQLLHPGGIETIMGGIAGVGVHGHAIGVGDHGGVVGGFHAAFELEGVDAALHQLGDVLDHAHVAGGEEEGAEFGFFNGHGKVRALFLVEGIVPAAGLGAGAAVAVTAGGEHIGQQAAAAVGDAHGAVDEGLQLDVGGQGCLDGADLVELQFPREHETLGAEGGVGLGGGGTDDAGLGGDVNLHVGEHFLYSRHDAEVGDDDGIDTRTAQLIEKGAEGGIVAVAGHGVEGQVDLLAHAVGEADGGVDFLGGEVAGLGAHAESAAGEIDRVGSVEEGGFEFFKISCGGEQFGHGDPLLCVM